MLKFTLSGFLSRCARMLNRTSKPVLIKMPCLTKMDNKNTDSGYANMKKKIILVNVFPFQNNIFKLKERNC